MYSAYAAVCVYSLQAWGRFGRFCEREGFIFGGHISLLPSALDFFFFSYDLICVLFFSFFSYMMFMFLRSCSFICVTLKCYWLLMIQSACARGDGTDHMDSAALKTDFCGGSTCDQLLCTLLIHRWLTSCLSHEGEETGSVWWIVLRFLFILNIYLFILVDICMCALFFFFPIVQLMHLCKYCLLFRRTLLRVKQWLFVKGQYTHLVSCICFLCHDQHGVNCLCFLCFFFQLFNFNVRTFLDIIHSVPYFVYLDNYL